MILGGITSHLWMGICIAQEGVRWEPLSLQAAQQRAAQTRRLVLVHFWSPNCGPCQKMERLVFSRPDVAAAVEASYVPVKVNVDQFPYTARQFGITALPTDLILSPEGQVIRRFQGAVPAEQYIAQLQRVAMEMQVAGLSGAVGPTIPVGPPPVGGNLAIAEGRQIPDRQPIPGGQPIGGELPIPGRRQIPGGQPIPGGQSLPGNHQIAGQFIPGSHPISEGPSIAGPQSPPAWPSSWTPASALPETPTTSSYSGYQNPPVVAPVSDRYAGISSSGSPPTASPPGSGSSFGGVPPLGTAENSPLPLADRTMGSPPGGSPSVASSPSPPSSLNPTLTSQGDVAGKHSGTEVPTQQGGIAPTLPRGTDMVRAEAPPLGGPTSPGGSGGPMPDGTGGPTGEPVATDWPPGLPPLGLEGYCPVSLVEKRRWVLGTHPWGVIHEGRTYMCAGPEEQKKFLATPERYGPVMSGHDVVWAVERGQQVPGRREYGVFYRGRVYLFAEPATLDAFRKNPRRYLDAISSPSAAETASRH